VFTTGGRWRRIAKKPNPSTHVGQKKQGSHRTKGKSDPRKKLSTIGRNKAGQHPPKKNLFSRGSADYRLTVGQWNFGQPRARESLQTQPHAGERCAILEFTEAEESSNRPRKRYRSKHKPNRATGQTLKDERTEGVTG